MSFLYLLCLFTVLTPHTVFAENFAERMKRVYLETDKNFDIECAYSYNKTPKLILPASETIKTQNQLSRDFVIEGNGRELPMNFKLVRANGRLDYVVTINREHVSTGKLTNRDFYIAPLKDQVFAQEFETAKIYCKVNFAYALPYVLEDGNYHISVHPHKVYDWQSRLKAPIETYLRDRSFNSIILLETGNYRGELVNINKFFDGVEYKLPVNNYPSDLEEIPEDVPVVVSPAGNSRYDIKANREINITFTGGNHNYCIWNVTRHVIQDLMNSNSEAKVNFIYDTNAIVAQARGIEGEGFNANFSSRDVKRSNLLRDLLSRPDVQTRYHAAYLQYFRDFIGNQYQGMYKTYKIHYRAPGLNTTVELQGKGTRELEISLSYK